MSVSRQEEIIGCLWLIAGLVALNGGHTLTATLLLIKAGFDMLCAIGVAIYEARAERKENNDRSDEKGIH